MIKPQRWFNFLWIRRYELCSKYLPGAMCCGGITLFDALTNHSLCFGARKESLGHCWPQCSDIFFAFFFIGCRYVVRAQIPLERVHCGLSDLIRGQKFAQCAHIGFAIRTIGASAQWDQIAKIRQKFVTLIDLTYICNSLTHFENEVNKLTGNGNYV